MNNTSTVLELAPFPMAQKAKDDVITRTRLAQNVGIVVGIVTIIATGGLALRSCWQSDLKALENKIDGIGTNLDTKVAGMNSNLDTKFAAMNEKIVALQNVVYAPKAKAAGIKDAQISLTKAQSSEFFKVAYPMVPLQKMFVSVEVEFRIVEVKPNSLLIRPITTARVDISVVKIIDPGNPEIEIPFNGTPVHYQGKVEFIDVLRKNPNFVVTLPTIVIAVIARQGDQLVIATGESESKKS